MECLFSKWCDGSRVYHVIEVIPNSGKFAGMVVDVRYKALEYVDNHKSYLSDIVSSCDYIVGGKRVNIGGYGLFDMAGNPLKKDDLQQFLEQLVKAGDL